MTAPDAAPPDPRDVTFRRLVDDDLHKAGFRFAGTFEDSDGTCRLMVRDRAG